MTRGRKLPVLVFAAAFFLLFTSCAPSVTTVTVTGEATTATTPHVLTVTSSGSIAPTDNPTPTELAASITAQGPVVDVTGRLVCVQRENHGTFFTLYLTKAVPAAVKPGVTVAADGKLSNGLVYA